MKALAGNLQPEGGAAQDDDAVARSQNSPSSPSGREQSRAVSDELNMTQSLLLRHEQVAQRARRRSLKERR